MEFCRSLGSYSMFLVDRKGLGLLCTLLQKPARVAMGYELYILKGYQFPTPNFPRDLDSSPPQTLRHL